MELRVRGEQTQTVTQVGELGTWEGSSPVLIRELGYRNSPSINSSSFYWGHLKGISVCLCSSVLYSLIAAGLTSTLGCFVVALPAVTY